MNALQPLLMLLAQTERERDAASADAQRAAQAQAAAAAQAEQLVTYRTEYQTRWSEQFKREGKMELVNCYHGFMDRLSLAVDQQSRVAQQALTQVERLQAVVLEHEVRVASVRKLIQRRVHELQQSADRQEQKQTDEFAARAAWGRSAAANAALGSHH